MMLGLVVLCASAVAMLCAVGSLLTWLLLPAADRLGRLVAPTQRVWLWLGLIVLPGAMAFLALAVSFFPAVGWGADHCLLHGLHHPHLCPHHMGGTPGIILLVPALVLGWRLVHAVVGLVSMQWQGHRVSQLLGEGSELQNGVWIYESNEPNAFVLGRRIYASRALQALPSEMVEAVLAHERAHAQRRDPLWRALARFLSALHLPNVSASLRARLKATQEMAADLDAAASVHGGRLQVAQAIVKLSNSSRLAVRAHAPDALWFTEGDLEARVAGLLECPIAYSPWPRRTTVIAGFIGALAFVLHREAIHHGLETLLGALS